MNLLPVADSSNFVSVEVNAKEAILGAQDHPVLIDETGWQCRRVLDHADRVVQDLATTEHCPIWNILWIIKAR